MNYKEYAQALTRAEAEKSKEEFDSFFKNFLAILKKKKRVKILPQIAQEVQKIRLSEQKNKKTSMVVREKSLAEKYIQDVKKNTQEFDVDTIEIVENKNIIGGYIVKNQKYQIDNSYKKKLLDIYAKIVA